MTDMTQIPVGEAALVRRINRRLHQRGQQMFKTRSHAATRDVGDWFVVDLRQSSVSDARIELESYARKLEALAHWERLAV
jgi:hypothetical protein